jgi:hypothetical protein
MISDHELSACSFSNDLSAASCSGHRVHTSSEWRASATFTALIFAWPALIGIGALLFATRESAAATSITMTSDLGDYIGGGRSYLFEPLDGVISAAVTGGHVEVSFRGDDDWTYDFSSANNSQLVPGPYNGATRWPFNNGGNGLDVSGAGRGSNTLTGRFDVLEADYATDGSIDRFFADFEQHSEGNTAALRGQVRYDRADAVPTPDQIRAACHIDPARLQSLLRLKSAIPDAATGVYLTGDPGDYIVGNQTLTFLPSDANIDVTGTTAGVSVYLSTPGFSHSWSLDFLPPDLVPLTVGDWGGATRAPFHSPRKPGLEVSGDGRGSNRLTGIFDVLQADFGPDGKIAHFDAIFEQHSEGGEPASYGRVRYNSTVAEPSAFALAGMSVVGLAACSRAWRRRNSHPGCRIEHPPAES